MRVMRKGDAEHEDRGPEPMLTEEAPSRASSSRSSSRSSPSSSSSRTDAHTRA